MEVKLDLRKQVSIGMLLNEVRFFDGGEAI